MRNRRILTPGLAAVLSAALLFPACGGSGNGITTPPTPSPTPPQLVKRLVIQGSDTGLGDHVLGVLDFTTAAAGTLEAHVDWTFSNSNIGVFLVNGTCSVDQFNVRACQFLASSESSTQKPRVLTTASTPAGPHQLLVANYGPNEEAVSYQIFLTSAAGASAASAGRAQNQPSWTTHSMLTNQ